MKRKKQLKKADAILTGDWHLQDKQPVARTDNFWETQWSKLDFLSELQKEHDCTVLHSGDLFDDWKPSLALLAKTIEHLLEKFWTVYGNHDLPQHNIDLAYKCGINVLEKALRLSVLSAGHWGSDALSNYTLGGRLIHVQHIMTYQGRKPWPGCTDPTAFRLLRKHPQFDLILTGHNHKPFVEYYEGRCLVNPGSIFRLESDQKDFKPRVYLWYADTNTVEPVYLPIKDVITDEHITEKKERDERVDAFITQLDTDWTAKLSFEDNLEEMRKAGSIKKPILDIIYKAMED